MIFKSSESDLSLSRVFYGNSTNSRSRRTQTTASQDFESIQVMLRLRFHPSHILPECVARHWPHSKIPRYTTSQTRDRARPGPERRLSVRVRVWVSGHRHAGAAVKPLKAASLVTAWALRRALWSAPGGAAVAARLGYYQLSRAICNLNNLKPFHWQCTSSNDSNLNGHNSPKRRQDSKATLTVNFTATVEVAALKAKIRNNAKVRFISCSLQLSRPQPLNWSLPVAVIEHLHLQLACSGWSLAVSGGG